MEGERFDSLARLLTITRSRRRGLALAFSGTLNLVLGASLADETIARKKCPPCKKRKKGKCKAFLPDGTACDGGACQQGVCQPSVTPPADPCPGQKQCNGACIPNDRCCTDADCGLRRLCASGLCVIGQGTCLAGADICNVQSGSELCGQTRTDCSCLTSTSNQTRCGGANVIAPVCGDCLSDADCARKYPGVPGAFCVQGTGAGCVCNGSTFCFAPCLD